jgi:hypothetical protein
MQAVWVTNRRLEAQVAEASGVINAAHGVLVQAVMEVIADPRVALGPGVHSPAAWLAWKAGISKRRASDIARLARRAHELPVTIAALVEGSLALDQAAVIAQHVPAAFEAAACDVGKHMTVSQLRSALPAYGYEEPGEKPVPPVSPDVGPDREMSSGRDERGWWLNARLPADEGAVVDQAIAAIRDDLYRSRQAEAADGVAVKVCNADALVAMAETALHAGEIRFPGTDRYLVHLHLEAAPDPTETAMLSLHLGARLPRWLQEYLSCDCTGRIQIDDHGTPLNVGRLTRVIGRRLRRAIEHRDRGCVIPGCGAKHGLQVHHIVHWEHGGPTDTNNLVAVCRSHHRAHHEHHLTITGNPNLAAGIPGALTVTDRYGRIMESSGQPTPPRSCATPTEAAADAGINAEPYEAPYGERLNRLDFFLQPDRPRTPPEPHDKTHRPGGPPPDSNDPPPADEPDPTTGTPGNSQRPDRATGRPVGDPARHPGPTRAGPEDLPKAS